MFLTAPLLAAGLQRNKGTEHVLSFGLQKALSDVIAKLEIENNLLDKQLLKLTNV